MNKALKGSKVIVEWSGWGWLVHTFNANRWFADKDEALKWATKFSMQYAQPIVIK